MALEELGQIFTEKLVSDYMVSLLSIKKTKKVLDPCFGGAVFIDSLISAGFMDITGCEIDKGLFSSAKARYGNMNLVNGDFLKYNPSFLFDGIIMNPPYIRQEKIDELSIYGISKKELFTNNIYSALPKTANLYMFFVLKGLSLLRENGEMIVIFPSSWIDARTGDSFKAYLYTNCDVIDQIFIHGEVFEGNALVDVVILKIVNRRGGNKTKVKYLSAQKGILFEIRDQRDTISLDFTERFSKYASIRRGLTTGYNEMFINPKTSQNIDQYIKPIISSPKDFTGYSTADARFDKLLFVSPNEPISSELEVYLESYKELIIKTQSPKAMYDKVIQNKNWYKLSEIDGEGLIFSYFVRNEMKFVLNQGIGLIRDNFYIIYPKIDVFLMFALLNNYYTFLQLEKIGKKYGGGLLKLQRYDIESLNFPDINCLSIQDTQILKELSKNVIDNNDSNGLIEITRIISNYTSIGFDTIIESYSSIKKNRLENA